MKDSTKRFLKEFGAKRNDGSELVLNSEQEGTFDAVEELLLAVIGRGESYSLDEVVGLYRKRSPLSWFFSSADTDTGTGRTLLSSLVSIKVAMDNPGKWVPFIDHVHGTKPVWATDKRALMHAVSYTLKSADRLEEFRVSSTGVLCPE